jgi:hypothetical protein
MMNIYVTFYGIALFQRESANGRTTSVIVDLPNGRASHAFLDGTHAHPHFAWLVSTENAVSPHQPFPPIGDIAVDLNGVSVAIEAEGGSSGVNDADLADLPTFSQFAEHVARIPDDRLIPGGLLAARLVMSQGRFNVRKTDTSKVKFTFNEQLKKGPHAKNVLGYDVMWSLTGVNKAKVELRRLSDGNVTFKQCLTGNHVYLTIGNLPTRFPNEWYKVTSPVCGQVSKDTYHHFKLLYQLLDSTQDAWHNRVDPQRTLPVPEGTCEATGMAEAKPMAITTTTCVPGEWP